MGHLEASAFLVGSDSKVPAKLYVRGMKTWCGFRVPDHTDHVDCGAAVVRADRCAKHIREDVSGLRADNKELRSKIAKNNAQIKQLLGK